MSSQLLIIPCAMGYSSLNSISIHGVADSSKIPITFEQHQHLLRSVLHKFLSGELEELSQETLRNNSANVVTQESTRLGTIERDSGTSQLRIFLVFQRSYVLSYLNDTSHP